VIWDTSHNSTIEQYLMWGTNVDIIIIFGEDYSYENKMKHLFPNAIIKYYNPTTFINDLLTM
jgi:hypothetical protein